MADRMLDELKPDMVVEFAVDEHIYATVIDIRSSEYNKFRNFQQERFARLQSTRVTAADSSPTYVEATHTLPSEIVPIIVRRRRALQAVTDAYSGEDDMIGIARLELPGATLIESMIALRDGSTAAEALANGRAAEIGGFATLEGISRLEIMAVVDAVIGVIVQLARQQGIDWLWIFPRAAFMSILRANIPDAMPPYHFTLSPDVAGWKDASAQLEAFRAMHLRGFLDVPLIYQIATETFAEDHQARMSEYDARVQLGSKFGPLLGRAMITVQRTLRQEIEFLYPSPTDTRRAAEIRTTAAPEAPVTKPTNGQRVRRVTGRPARPAPPAIPAANIRAFLPEGLSENVPLATYLRRVVSEGGVPVQAYKELSYSLLQLERGQRILDVGCGAGIDLPILAQLSGRGSTVVGLEINPALVSEARELASQHVDTAAAKANILVFQGDAEHMTIPDKEFDRARTDRALQHFPHPHSAIAEIWRVLKPGGILTLVEPDWGSMVVAPGSATVDEDGTVGKTLDWCRQRLANPLMGRNLTRLLHDMPVRSWQSINVVVAPFTFTDWQSLDNVLLLSHAAAALQREAPQHADEIDEWLYAVNLASENGSFFGYVPMFYAVAVKAADRLPGV